MDTSPKTTDQLIVGPTFRNSNYLIFDILTDKIIDNQYSLYKKIMDDSTNKHNFTFECNDGKEVKIPIHILAYYVPYLETLLNFGMREVAQSKVTIDFSSEDIQYMIWYSITGFPFKKEELEIEYSNVISCQEWIHRFEILQYFFVGDKSIKKIIKKCLFEYICPDYLDKNCVIALLHLEIDISKYIDNYIDIICQILYESKPFDIELMKSILIKVSVPQGIFNIICLILYESKPFDIELLKTILIKVSEAQKIPNGLSAPQKIPNGLFNLMLWNEGARTDPSLLKFLLGTDIAFTDFNGAVCKVGDILGSNPIDKELIDILRKHKKFGKKYVNNFLRSYFTKKYDFYAARADYFNLRLEDLVEVVDDHDKLNLIFKEIFTDYLTSSMDPDKKKFKVWDLHQLSRENTYAKYHINLRVLKSISYSEQLNILTHDHVITPNDFYKEYVIKMMPWIVIDQ